MKLSIIIPTFNELCVTQVEQLLEQLPEGCEILVGDDGSTDESVKASNRLIASLPHCLLWESPVNLGRSAMRNRLVSMAKGEWVLLLDAAIEITEPDFLAQYLHATETRTEDIFVGGVSYPDHSKAPYRLRWAYERDYSHRRDKGKDVCVSLKTGNCLIRRKALLDVPFREDIHTYGYEDTLLGQELVQRGYTMCNFPTRVNICKMDSNEDFLRKTHEANAVLRQFAATLESSSALLQTAKKAERMHLTPFLRLFHRLFHRLLERQLCSAHPSVTLFQLWKLGDLITFE